jgi:hypothetical protein
MAVYNLTMRDPTTESADDELKSLSPRLDALDGARIGFHVNAKEAARPVSQVVEEKLADRYPNLTFTRCDVPARDEEGLTRIEEWAASETDACIATVGDCGGCTRAVVRAANAIEAGGTPAVGLVADGFELSWETNANDQGRYLRSQTLPIRSETTDLDVLRDQIDADVLSGIETALTQPLTDQEKGLAERDLLS